MAGPVDNEGPCCRKHGLSGIIIPIQTHPTASGLAPWQPPSRGEMTTPKWRISPHFDHPHTRLDQLAILAGARITRNRLRIPCPAHGGTNPNLELKVAGDRISAVCFSQGCSYRDIAQAIEAKFGISIGRGHNQEEKTLGHTGTRPPVAPTASLKGSQDLRTYALQLWGSSISIPRSSDHPARKWLAIRHLWRPEFPLPGPVRWISALHLHREFKGAGAVVAMAAQPTGWTRAWPNLPELSCIQLVFVAQDGNPAMDRGLNKRTYASTQGAIIVLGCPHLRDAPAPVDIAEGLADALALASRSPAPAVATLGTAGMSSSTTADWLATSLATRVWADRDESRAGRAPPGQRHGRELVRLVNDAGGNATALHAPTPHKDPAAAAAAIGFNNPGPAWTDYAKTLAETTDWPRWEIARQAIAICSEEE